MQGLVFRGTALCATVDGPVAWLRCTSKELQQQGAVGGGRWRSWTVWRRYQRARPVQQQLQLARNWSCFNALPDATGSKQTDPDIKIVTLEPSCLRYLCSQTISPNLLLSNTDPNPTILVRSTAERSLFYQSCVLVILVGSSAILVLIQGRTILVDRKAKLLLPPHFPKLPLFICPRFRGHVNVCAQRIRPFCPGVHSRHVEYTSAKPISKSTPPSGRSRAKHWFWGRIVWLSRASVVACH